MDFTPWIHTQTREEKHSKRLILQVTKGGENRHARDSKSREGNLVSVRFRPPAPRKIKDLAQTGSVPVTCETPRKRRKNKRAFVPITRYRDTTKSYEVLVGGQIIPDQAYTFPEGLEHIEVWFRLSEREDVTRPHLGVLCFRFPMLC